MVAQAVALNFPLDVVVVNYNTGTALRRCLAAVGEQGAVVASITVVDNASTDDSLDLPARLLDQVDILRNDRNPGFGTACNQGARRGRAPGLLFLNPDCYAAPGALAYLSDALAGDSALALVGGHILNPSGQVQRASRRLLPTLGRALQTALGFGSRGVDQSHTPLQQGVQRVEAVSGACMAVRREAFEAIGGFDEAFVLHCEDLDLMRRLTDAGWGIAYQADAEFIHEQGLSSRRRPLWVHYHKHRGLRRYYLKHLAGRHNALQRMVVSTAIGLRFIVTLPMAWWQSQRRQVTSS